MSQIRKLKEVRNNMGMMGKMMEGMMGKMMAKAMEKYDVVELDKEIETMKEYEQKGLTLTEIIYILMNSKINKIIIIHRE